MNAGTKRKASESKRSSRKRICNYETCSKRSSFNESGSRVAKWCKTHKQPGDVNVKSKRCAHDGCNKHPAYAEDSKVAKWCKTHKQAGDIDVKNKRCAYDGCKSYPLFNTEGSSVAKWCKAHKQAGDMDVKNKRCAHDGCNKQSLFNAEGSSVAKWCKAHKQAEDVNVKSKRCAHDGCNKQPHFNAEDSKVAKWCKTHKQAGDVDVKHKQCAHEGCKSRPLFNAEGSKVAGWCKTHKQEGDIDVKNKRCAHDSCKSISPVFNAEGCKVGKWCKTHKQAGDVDVKSKRCAHDGCKSINPVFNAEGSKVGKWCKTHKQAGDVDVKNKRCAHDGCSTRVLYGEPGKAPSHCAVHKTTGQIVKPKRVCESCQSNALFGAGSAPERCQAHAKECDRDLVQRACINCGLIDIVGSDGRCGDCDPGLFTRVRLRQQREIRALLLESDLPKFETYDKVLQAGACGKERPDFTWPTGVVLEVDEHQHKSYVCDESVRMVNITGAMGQPTLWVRYNPDEYTGWRSGMRALERQDYLVRFLRQHLAEPQIHSRVVHLFFDGFTGVPEFTSLNVI